MLFADLTGAEWVLMIGAFFLGLGQIVTIVMNYFVAKNAAIEAENVRTTLVANTAKTDDTLATITTTSNTIHTLVNSQMGTQLRLNAVAMKRLAMLTNNPDDIKAADAAAAMVVEHEKKQDKADSQDGITNGDGQD